VTFEQMWRDLEPIGRSRSSGGYFRQPFLAAERECRDWFVEQCVARGMTVETDGNANQVGWWRPDGPSSTLDGVLTGSHLDSVLDGGAYDGPLGVVSGLAAIDMLRDRGFVPQRPIGVACFVEEEGSRFGVACLGSRLLTGSLPVEQALRLRDRDGVLLADALDSAGHSAEPGPSHITDQVACFIELHVEQGRDLVHRDRAVGVGSQIWPHGRYRLDFTGEANHAGTTAMRDRRDPMLTYAATALAAQEVAADMDATEGGARATFGRLEVTPNGTNAVPSRVRAWLDARAPDEDALRTVVDLVRSQAEATATAHGTRVRLSSESVSPAAVFDPGLATRLARLLGDAPVIPTGAGHDAGVLAQAGVPTAMLFVRNPTGVSHSPAEYADTADCLRGVEALTTCLQDLAGNAV
jgi:beta-ureidopropionase / N-carbamoyl-L-amino-acid hydrolase